MCERTQSDNGTLLFLPRVCHRHNTLLHLMIMLMCIIGKVNKNRWQELHLNKHLDGSSSSSSSSKQFCLFKLDFLRFKAEQGALRVVWASEPSNTRAPESNIYYAYTSACQKNSSGGKLNIKKAFQPLKEMSGREPDKLTQRGTGCVFCVYSCLSSDESSPQICRHT